MTIAIENNGDSGLKPQAEAEALFARRIDHLKATLQSPQSSVQVAGSRQSMIEDCEIILNDLRREPRPTRRDLEESL